MNWKTNIFDSGNYYFPIDCFFVRPESSWEESCPLSPGIPEKRMPSQSKGQCLGSGKVQYCSTTSNFSTRLLWVFEKNYTPNAQEYLKKGCLYSLRGSVLAQVKTNFVLLPFYQLFYQTLISVWKVSCTKSPRILEERMSLQSEGQCLGSGNNYLQLLCREIIEFLLYQFGLQNITSVARDILQAKLVKGTRGEVKILISRKSCCTAQFYRLLE